MDLIRKMSSGLRSSQEFSAALPLKNDEVVEPSEKSSDRGEEEYRGEEEEEEDGNDDVVLVDAEQDDIDVFEDAAAAPGGQQQHEHQQHDDGEGVDEEEGSGQQQVEGASPLRVRAPVSDEVEEVEDDQEDGGEEEEEEGEDDGDASFGSGESYDSALERMAASSTTSYNTPSSPRISSPVGSLSGPAVLGYPPTVMSVSQQGALMRLNEMLAGESSLDTTLIDNSSPEEFKDRISELADRRGKSVDDASFGSILDALLPLVFEKNESHENSLEPSVTNREAEASPDANEDSKQAQSPMPKAKLTAEDEAQDESDDEENEDNNHVHAAENGALQNGDGHDDADDDEKQVSESKERDPFDSEEMPKALVTSESNGGKDEGLEDAEQLDSASQYGSGDEADPAESCDDKEEEGYPKLRAPASDPDPGARAEVLPAADTSEDAAPRSSEETGEATGTQDPPQQAEEAEVIQPRPAANDDGAGSTEGNEERAEVEEENSVQGGPPEEKAEGEEETVKPPPGVNPEAGVEPESTPEAEYETIGNLDDREDEDEDEEANSDEESEEDEEDGETLMERSSALAALVRAADSAAGGEADTPTLGIAGPSLPARPVPRGRSSLPSLEPAARVGQQARSIGAAAAAPARLPSLADDGLANAEAPDGNEETREKLQEIRVKFLRLAMRLGQSAHNVIVAQVLYRLGLAEQLRGGRSSRNAAFSFDRASAIAEEQEAAGPEELDFLCTIMLLGKTGVGKSATINSIFDEQKTDTNAFSPSTKKVQVITGHVHGIKVRVIDTPGLLPSVADQRHNEKVMGSLKSFIKKQAPDIVLYFDRLDMQSRDYGDLPLLRTITDTFGAAVWFNAIVVLTHASSAPPDGSNGLPLSYETFVTQRSHVVQHTIRQAAGDMRLMNPVSLVENHRACRVNRSRERVLPNGQVWKPQLLLLCFASKILAEANTLLKLQDSNPGRAFGARPRVPPLPFLLSSLLQSRAQLKLPDEQMGDEDESDEELDDDADSDEEEDYDQLPPFRRLSQEEVAELDEDNRGKYFEELAERERLFQKKQWKEELKRRRGLKRRMAEASNDQSPFVDEGLDEEEAARSAAVPVPMPDMALPPSFDSDNPSHRYRYLETANQWIVRPVLETHGWDHDNGYDGMSVEKMFVVRETVPASISGTITKDKKEASMNLECAASIKHGEGKVTLAGLDVQSVLKDFAYTLRSETRFSNFKGNKTTGGLALTVLGDTVSAGMKIEDRLIVGKRVKLVMNGGAITGRGDVAYGGSLEATLRDKDYPLSRTLSTLGVSIMDWHGDLAIGGNLQTQFMLGKTMMVSRANLNNRGAGQISIRASSSEQIQMALIGLLPIFRSLLNRLLGSQSQQ